MSGEMMLSDYHIHSRVSPDARDSMTDMAEASFKAGVSRLCFTDHVDLDMHSTGKPDPSCFSGWPEMLEQYRDAREALPYSDIRLGIEFGEFNHDTDAAAEIAGTGELDFILGSLHNLRDTADFYSMPYTDAAQCGMLYERYLDELIEMADMPYFDVMAHIGYPVRYMLNAGFDIKPEISFFGDRLELLLRKLISAGKGIECNCSGYRSAGIRGPIPSPDILKMYRRLGGEIVTVGTDAHRTADAGVKLREGYDLLKHLGFRYITGFSGRKPEFTAI